MTAAFVKTTGSTVRFTEAEKRLLRRAAKVRQVTMTRLLREVGLRYAARILRQEANRRQRGSDADGGTARVGVEPAASVAM